MFRITEVYNNLCFDKSFIPDFGFSCFIEGQGILFDTGAKTEILYNNLSVAGIGKNQINAVFLSHDHWDHNGGLSVIEKLNNQGKKIKSYALSSFSGETLDYLSENSDLHIVKSYEEIVPGIFSTGPLGDETVEQSLFMRSKNGFVVVSGCSHPHIENILSFVRNHGSVYGLIGGLHDVSDCDLKSLSGIFYLAPSHCTKRIDEIRSLYEKSFRKGGVGCLHLF
ncbi:7,8-dihydropterin-6-yl-methyl-4-(beta-D-ribofuranosyl)aminobenzene 5'-phosphate synthase [Methanomicrobium sp. W14]|uniref:MBL fold metallo-hydrolase n=1 Tax=Methanomicrobium sp. W14 TaxID=2817839 RepID=UPI001AE43734|nr:MBL fold metallo-hydrolase [Methanomicrobium sp. W14]MBP2134601.1 7,8-dihydropterin-6-yl-methyl-4-(beta-D-ribofuranosyl)aminobenzene 5'-phosphate synthase [Methanomicrobium sp. W14]